MSFLPKANVICIAVLEPKLEAHCFQLTNDRTTVTDVKSSIRELVSKVKSSSLEHLPINK
jgi:hypothetical protein